MDPRIRHYYIYISCCVLLISQLEAKSISLNDIIAAEEKEAPQASRATASRFDTSEGTSYIQSKKISPLKYRRVYQIKSPSKPKKLNLAEKSRHRRKNFTKKREIDSNDGIIQNYIPLLKNLRMLVNNILGSDSSETYESSSRKFKRNPISNNDTDKLVCTCERKSTTESTYEPQKETSTAPASTIEIEDENVTDPTIVTTTSTHIAVDDNISSIERYKDIPVLSTRNSTSVWRNDSGLGQRSCPTFHRSVKGYITGNNGDSEPNTGREPDSHKESHEEYTDSSSRIYASYNKSSEGFQRLGTNFGDPEIDSGTGQIDESTVPRNKTLEDITRNVHKYQRNVEYEIRRDETESSTPIPIFISRLREFDSQEKDTSFRDTEIDKKSILQNPISIKRISGRDGFFASENQEISSANKAIEQKHVLPNSTFPVGKVVMIFDGYSVAKDVNGNNKLTEKAIHIHT